MFAAVAAGRTTVGKGSDWPSEQEEEVGRGAERSGGSVLFPTNDLARSRHCSASLNIRSTSTATISRSSEEKKAEKGMRKSIPDAYVKVITWHLGTDSIFRNQQSATVVKLISSSLVKMIN